MLEQAQRKQSSIQPQPKGFLIVEALVGIMLFLFFTIIVSGIFSLSVQHTSKLVVKSQAQDLLFEGVELLRYKRDTNWATIAAIPLNQVRSVSADVGGVNIHTNSTSIVLDGTSFTRAFTVYEVCRPAGNGDIMDNTFNNSCPPPRVDPNMRLIRSTVSWQDPRTSVVQEESIDTYIANIW
jgi:hypothetical protein